MKTFLTRSMLGILFGGFLTVVITFLVIYLGGHPVLDSGIFVRNSLGMIFSGWFFTVTPLYFENENWSLLRQSVYHFLTVLLLYLITALYVGWFSLTVKSLLGFVGLFLVVYGAIWLAFYFYYKNEARKLNEELSKL